MNEDMDNQNMIRPAFTKTHLEESTRDIISISFNSEERSMLEQFKQESRIPHDSKAIKFLMSIGFNVIHTNLGSKNIKYLASENRTKTIE
jgi:hypothetical protein